MRGLIPVSPRFLSELQQLTRLATPLLTAQLLVTGIGTVDTIMAGNYHANDLAAVAVGASLWMPLSLLLAGLMIAVTSMVARLHGGNRAGSNRAAIRATVQQGIWLGLAVAAVAVLILRNSRGLLELFAVEPAVAAISERYLDAVALGLPAAALYHGLRSYCEGMGQTRPYMISCLAAFLLNIPLNYGLIYGRWGLPELGGAGCGWATAAVMWLQVVMLTAFVRRPARFDGIHLLRHWQAPQLAAIGSVAALGVPIALGVFAEITIFSAIALLLAPLGAVMVAGHQIALSVSHLIFMIPLSLSQAITIRVGYLLGRGQQDDANYVVRVSMICAVLVAGLTMVFILAGRSLIAGFYTDDTAVIAVAMPLFVLMAIYQLPDQIQIYSNAALRAYHDTRQPLQMILLSYWGVCLPLGFVLARTDWLVAPMGAAGFWTGLVVGLCCSAMLLGWRLRHTLRRPLL